MRAAQADATSSGPKRVSMTTRPGPGCSRASRLFGLLRPQRIAATSSITISAPWAATSRSDPLSQEGRLGSLVVDAECHRRLIPPGRLGDGLEKRCRRDLGTNRVEVAHV